MGQELDLLLPSCMRHAGAAEASGSPLVGGGEGIKVRESLQHPISLLGMTSLGLSRQKGLWMESMNMAVASHLLPSYSAV